MYAPEIVDGAVLAELRTIDPIESLEGGFDFMFQLTMDAQSTKLGLFQTLEGLAGCVNGILIGIYNGWEQPVVSGEDWVPFDPSLSVPPA
jgi:hypothetical protein